MKPEQIRLARDLLQLAQADLALAMDVHPQTISKWERGQLDPSPIQREILRGVLYNAASVDHEQRLVGKEIRRRLYRSDLFGAHAALVGHAYQRRKP